MVQVFDPTEGNMTPCTESLRYLSYVKTEIKMGEDVLNNVCHKLFHCF